MDESFLAALTTWQQAGERRCVDITIGGVNSKDEIKVWCYDYALMDGSHVHSAEEVYALRLTDKQLEKGRQKLQKMAEEMTQTLDSIRRLEREPYAEVTE